MGGCPVLSVITVNSICLEVSMKGMKQGVA